jgi:Flp pilus assembly protein TadG
MTFSVAVPVLMGAVAVAVDSASLFRMQGQIQSIADSTALATAKEIAVYGAKTEDLEQVGEARAHGLLEQSGLGSETPRVDVTVDQEAGTARVNLSVVGRSLLPVSVFAENPITVSAEAKSFGELRLCVLSLAKNTAEAVRVKEAGSITAPDCAVQANSVDPTAITLETGGQITADQTCSSGGVVGPATSFLPQPARTECPALSDPLGSRTPPPVGTCKPALSKVSIKSGTKSLNPDTYCNGLTIGGTASVTLNPGVYVIRGGKLTVNQGATLRGENVILYFADDNAWFDFSDKALVELSAPKDGPLAGVLLMENPAAKLGKNYSIGSGNVKKLLGTIYLPKGTLNIWVKGAVADESAYTVIVTQKLDVKEANLVINSDYGGTDVPVPNGLGTAGGEIQLTN